MTISENLIIPLALALVGTLIGSYLTAVSKIYTVFPPLLVNWLIGLCLYILLVRVGIMPLDMTTAGLYCIINLGVNLGYWKNIAGLRDHVNEWARGGK